MFGEVLLNTDDPTKTTVKYNNGMVLSDDGDQKLTDLLIARFFIIHSELKEDDWWILNKEHYKNVWKLAIESKVKWPGFEKRRLYLSRADKKFLKSELEQGATLFD